MKNDTFIRYYDGSMGEAEKAAFEKLLFSDNLLRANYEKFTNSMLRLKTASSVQPDESYLSEALVRARAKIDARKEKKFFSFFKPAYSLTMVSVVLTLLLVYTSTNNKIIRNEISNSGSESYQVENLQKELLLNEETVTNENIAETLNNADIKKIDEEIKGQLGIEKNEVVIANAYELDVKEIAEQVSSDELDRILEKLDKEFEL